MKKICSCCSAEMVEKVENGRFFWECPWCGKKQLGLSTEILNTLKPRGREI